MNYLWRGARYCYPLMEHPSRIGKYEVEEYLGGGMSRVYRAKDSVLGRRVALKVLAESAASDPEAKARFLQEARLASSIAHENIIAVYDFGEEEGRPFMVMEFLEGESLRDAIEKRRTGDFARRLQIALQVGRAIGHIHLKKIIHRDIKPENIHLDPLGRAKLMDFGIAKPEGMRLANTGFTVGTPYYMSPEQVLGQDVTTQADVYSFGVLLYELLAGKKPIEAENSEKSFTRYFTIRSIWSRCTKRRWRRRRSTWFANAWPSRPRSVRRDSELFAERSRRR